MQTSLFNSEPLALNLPAATISYWPHFIPQQQSCYRQLRDSLAWQQDNIQVYGRLIPIPRLNAWYGDPGKDYSYSGIQLTATPWTQLLRDIKLLLEEKLDTGFNSVLANYYRDGNDSVGWHADDEPELGPAPLIASLSFGATRRFSLRHKTDRSLPIQHINLEGGSLLLMAGDTQRHWQHQLAKTRHSIGGRINLTFRSIIG
jgi:alkylated DNA repair dioxygenase AlkB